MRTERLKFPIENYVRESRGDAEMKRKLLQLVRKKNVSRLNPNNLPIDVKEWLINNGDKNFWTEVGIYSKRPDIVKLAIKAGHRPQNVETFDFLTLVGLDETFYGDPAICKITRTDIDMIKYLERNGYPIAENKTFIDALCWTAQVSLIKWAMEKGFSWSQYSLFDCLRALCVSTVKDYANRLAVIQLGVRHCVQNYEPYTRFTSIESLTNLCLVDDCETCFFILDENDEIVDDIVGDDVDDARSRYIQARDHGDRDELIENYNPQSSRGET
jgi:hypothetical protein